MSDFYTLRSAALSTTSFYEAYLLARPDALWDTLKRQYNGLVGTHEAIAAVRSKRLHAGRAQDRERIIALLDERRRSEEIRRMKKRSPPKQPYPDEPVDYHETLELVKLHEIAVWLLDDYSRHATCPSWIDATSWNTQVLPISFTRTEKQRYFRAFYRLQTFSNIFGPGENPLDGPPWGNDLNWSDNFDGQEVWRLFFSTMPPWEYEEFKCLWQHMFERFGEQYREISDDLESYGYEPNGLPDSLNANVLPSCALLETDDLRMKESDLRESLASLGPTFLFRLLKGDFMTRRNMVYANALSSYPCFPEVIPHRFSAVYPLLYPADRFNFGQDWEGFQAFLLTLPEIEQPNLSWQMTWLRKVSENKPLFEDMYATGVVHNSRLTWGYALWDTERLSKWASDWNAPMLARP